MNTKARSVLARMSSRLRRHKALAGVAVGALAATLFLMLGFARITGPGADPIASTMAPMSDSTVAPLLALDQATEAVAKRVIPAVVEITVDGKQAENAQMQQMDPQDIPAPFRQFFFQGPFQQQQQQPPQMFRAEGTGVIISPDGYIVTNNHVVSNASHVTVTLHDQRQFDAKVVGTDKATDLAVIKIDATGLTSAAWGDSSALQPGQTVLAIGDPMGMNFSVTRGIVSALNRPRNMSNNDPNARGVFIQTDAPINHGNSGGPLVNAYGQVVGINSEMLTSSGASEGIGFAIPSDLVKPTAASLIKNGKVVRGYLGIEVTDLIPSVAASLNDGNAKGALVNEVNAGSPAQSAGLKPYDVITGFNGHPVTSGTDLQTMAGAAAPGTVAHLNLLRNGTPVTVHVTMGDLAAAGSGTEAADNASASGNSSTSKLGASLEALTPDLRGQLQLPDSVHGLVVDSVTPGGPAMLAGIGRGDVIEQVNQHPVNSVGELNHQLGLTPQGKDILLLVHNKSGNFIIPVHPQADSGQ
jgi:serine protease Do